MLNLYDNSELHEICGGALRPGGLDITGQALELCSFKKNAVLIDLACGPGSTLKFLKEKGFETIGVDCSPALLEKAKSYGPVIKADFHQLPFENNFADGIFCECALSLATHKSKVLSECFRVLKAGGQLVISDIFKMQDEKIANAESLNKTEKCLSKTLSLKEMRGLLISNGFAVQHFFDHSPALKAFAMRLVWHFGSPAALHELVGGCSAEKLGYALLIAHVESERKL